MAQYIGFSTINACKPKTTNVLNGPDGGTGTTTNPIVYGKKFRMTDVELVIQDFINALNIPYGSKVGQPQFGTTIWNFIFDPNTLDVQTQLENEIRRVASLDPRIILDYVQVFPQENGILLEVQIAIAPFNQPQVVNIFFNQQTRTAVGR